MERVEKIVHYMTQRLSEIGQACLVLIMLLIIANITMRYFWAPVKGTYEIVEVLGALFLALGSAYCSATRSHIAVDFAVEKLTPRKQTIIDISTNLISLLFITFIGWGLMDYAGTIYQRGRETTALGIPLFPVCYMVCFGIYLLALVVLVELLRLILVLFKQEGK